MTLSRTRVLVMDDDPRWRDVLTDNLLRNGISTDSAATTTETYSRLEENCYHLLVLDIQMDEDDPNDDTGLHLLGDLHERGLDQVFKVVMLTGHGNMQRMREAFAQLKVGDFLDKGRYDPAEFLIRVQKLLSELQFRPDLDIIWQPIDAPKHLVPGLMLGTTRVVSTNTVLVSRAVNELEDLLCRLFYKAKSTIFNPLTPGFSGAKVLQAQPFVEHGGGRPIVVKFGGYANIRDEWNNYDRFVQPFLGGRSTTILERQRSMHFGGIVYSLLDAADDRVRDFEQFYRYATPTQIRRVLDSLFLDTCREWYGGLSQLLPCDLTEDYQRSLNFSEERLARVLTEQFTGVQVTASTLTFDALSSDRSFTNPIAAMANQRLIRPTYRCITHGDLNQRNILVDKTDRAWLIDFARTGYSHFLRDVVLLDSIVRFELLAGHHATLSERLQLEELLLATQGQGQRQRLKAGAALSNPHVAKAFAVTVHLRSLAKQLGPRNLRYDRSGYDEGLLYTAMNTMKFYQMTMVQREHALLCASLMADRLKA